MFACILGRPFNHTSQDGGLRCTPVDLKESFCKKRNCRYFICILPSLVSICAYWRVVSITASPQTVYWDGDYVSFFIYLFF